MFFQSNRKYFKNAKSCRQRWYNHVDPVMKRQDFSLQEDLKIITCILKSGKSWSKIVKDFNYQRTQHKIKNRYNTIYKKYQSRYQVSSQLDQEEAEQYLLKKMKKQYESLLLKNSQSLQQKQQVIETLDNIKNDVESQQNEQIMQRTGLENIQEKVSKGQERIVKYKNNQQIGSIINTTIQQEKSQDQRIQEQKSMLKVQSQSQQLIEGSAKTAKIQIKIDEIVCQNDWMWNYYPFEKYYKLWMEYNSMLISGSTLSSFRPYSYS